MKKDKRTFLFNTLNKNWTNNQGESSFSNRKEIVNGGSPHEQFKVIFDKNLQTSKGVNVIAVEGITKNSRKNYF